MKSSPPIFRGGLPGVGSNLCRNLLLLSRDDNPTGIIRTIRSGDNNAGLDGHYPCDYDPAQTKIIGRIPARIFGLGSCYDYSSSICQGRTEHHRCHHRCCCNHFLYVFHFSLFSLVCFRSQFEPNPLTVGFITTTVPWPTGRTKLL